ncbi:hypothetical protein F1544_17595 [Kineosporiaceae bacterium B12]|nr:hypothetical protein [Kineococcus rubinsiae]
MQARLDHVPHPPGRARTARQDDTPRATGSAGADPAGAGPAGAGPAGAGPVGAELVGTGLVGAGLDTAGGARAWR